MSAMVSPQPLLGVALKVGSTLAFTSMTTVVKIIADRYPVGEIIFARSFFAVIPVLVWVGFRGGLSTVFVTRNVGGHMLRSIAGASSMFLGFLGLARLPIADATAIGYASPLMTVVFAVLLLGEKVRIYRWSAVIIGLAGVLVILSDYVGPSSATDAAGRSTTGAMFAVASALVGALAATQTRSLTRYEDAATIVVYFSLFTALAALFTLPLGWVMPDLTDFAFLLAAGIFGGIGQVLLTQSYRFGEASVIAPFDYTSMIWSLAASVVIFGTWPTSTVLAGTAIVVSAGLFVIYREHRLDIERSRSRRAQTPTTPSSST